MHDPMTVAFEVKYPWWKYPPGTQKPLSWPKGYRETFITIWHVDPELDGSDDSCGWFKRARHGDPKMLAAIERAFEFEWDAEYGAWFRPTGEIAMDVSCIVLDMFMRAVHQTNDHNWRNTERFMKNHLFEILHLAGNTTDSMWGFIVGEKRNRREAIAHAASVVYGCILRWSLPRYRHPRWHIHHWKIQIHPLQNFKRWAFSRCEGCRKAFSWGYSPVTAQWNNGGPRWFRSEQNIYHSECMPRPERVIPQPNPIEAVDLN